MGASRRATWAGNVSAKGGRPAGALACPLECESDNVGMGHVPSDSLQQGGLQRRRPVLIEQAQQRRSDAAQVVAAKCGHLQQSGGRGGDLGERVAAAVRARSALVLDQRLLVSGLLDHFAAIEAAPVIGEFGEAVEDPPALLIGKNRHGALDMGMRHAV